MTKYWIKSLSEWAPEVPAYPCSHIDDAIKSMETVRQINDELRKALDEAINIIRYLDWRVVELEAELSLRKEDSD